MENKITSQFTSTYNKGFHMTFSNGISISVQFGTANYCERRSYYAEYASEMSENIVNSSTAEIAIWDSVGGTFNFGNDTVMGWVTSDEVAIWIDLASKARTLTELETFAIENNLVMPA